MGTRSTQLEEASLRRVVLVYGGGVIIILDKGAVIHVTAIYIRQDAIQVSRNESAVFLQWWRQKAADLRAPKYTPRGTDRRLAAQLVQRHGLDKLKLLGVVFWQNYSTPLIEGEYHQHMVLFQARMAEAQRDLKNIQTTD